MLKHALNAALVLSFLTASSLALAQDEFDETEAAAAAAPAPKPEAAKASTEVPGGVTDVVGYKFPRGIYTTADLGIFWRYLGFADNGGTNQCFRCRYPTYFVSNAQPFIGISVGYDILPTIYDYIPGFKPPEFAKRFGISGQLSLGTGYVANAAPWSAARSNTLGSTTRPEESPKDYALLMVHPTLLFNFIPPPFERVVLEGRVFMGGVAITPSVQRFQRAFADPQWWMGTFGANVGFGLSIKYMTLLTNFVVGSDLAFYNVLSPGFGTELFVPPTGKAIDATNCANAPVGVCTANGKTNVVLPFTLANSFSPIIIKYVF